MPGVSECVCVCVCQSVTLHIFPCRPTKLYVWSRSRGWCGSWWSGVPSSCLERFPVMNSRSSSRKSPPRLTMATSMRVKNKASHKLICSCVFHSSVLSVLPSAPRLMEDWWDFPLCSLSFLCPLSSACLLANLPNPDLSRFPLQDPGAGPGGSGWGWEYFGPGAGQCDQSVSGSRRSHGQDQWTY